MNIIVKRRYFSDDCTIGDMYVDGCFECLTLEDRFREIPDMPVKDWKVDKMTAIPRGTYKVIIDYSDRFQRSMPHILNVPGFTGVRIHSGNNDHDTEGCLLLGKIEGHNDIGESRDAFKDFYIKLQKVIIKGEECYITIT